MSEEQTPTAPEAPAAPAVLQPWAQLGVDADSESKPLVAENGETMQLAGAPLAPNPPIEPIVQATAPVADVAAIAPQAPVEPAVAPEAPAVEDKASDAKTHNVTVVVPKAFKLRMDLDTEIAISAGIQELPYDQATHWYSVANGVKIYTKD